MLHRSERILDNIPVGSLGIIAVDGCEEMGNKVNDYLVKWRKEETRFQKDNLVFNGYEKPNYLINAKVPRFGSGEAKGIINESVRGKDLYLMVDVCNYSLTYSLLPHFLLAACIVGLVQTLYFDKRKKNHEPKRFYRYFIKILFLMALLFYYSLVLLRVYFLIRG